MSFSPGYDSLLKWTLHSVRRTIGFLHGKTERGIGQKWGGLFYLIRHAEASQTREFLLAHINSFTTIDDLLLYPTKYYDDNRHNLHERQSDSNSAFRSAELTLLPTAS
jgi:hypothetical protein